MSARCLWRGTRRSRQRDRLDLMWDWVKEWEHSLTDIFSRHNYFFQVVKKVIFKQVPSLDETRLSQINLDVYVERRERSSRKKRKKLKVIGALHFRHHGYVGRKEDILRVYFRKTKFNVCSNSFPEPFPSLFLAPSQPGKRPWEERWCQLSVGETRLALPHIFLTSHCSIFQP